MLKTGTTLFVIGVLLAGTGCGTNQSGDSVQPPPPPAPDAKQTNSGGKYQGPPVTVGLLQLQTYPPQNVVSIAITAPSGGWALTLDKGEVAEQTARVFLTLEQPAAGEATTRALVDHQANYTTTEPFEHAEIYVNLTQRGVATTTPDYRLAKKVKVSELEPQLPPPHEGNGVPPGDPGAAPGQLGAADSEKYDGPPATVQIVQAKRLPPISTANIEVTAPTGGWTLNLDHAEIEGDLAKIYLTLERPGEGELVTQALTKLTQSYTSEKPPFYRVEVYIHLAQRGVHTFTTNYRLAASQR